MAFSATLKRRTLMGNLRAEVWEFDSAGVTTGSFVAGMGQVDHVQINNEVTEADGKAVVSSNNTITLSGLTSNDTGTVLVIGL